MHWQQSRPKSKQLFLPDSLWIFDWTQWVSRSESCCILAGVMSRLVFLWVTTSLTNHGTSFGCGQVNWSRTGRVRSFLSNSVCPHFNFLSFYALLRINVPRLLPLPNRPPHQHHQSSTAKLFAYVTFTHLLIDGTRRRVWKKTPTLQLMWLICQFRPVHILGGWVHCTRLGKWANAPGRIW